MKRGLCIVLFVGVATAGLASTRVVDGVGAGANEFATIPEALADLAASADNGDGTTDVINVTASYTEDTQIVIDHSVLLDEVEINGNGNTIIFEDTAVADGHVFSIVADDGSLTTVSGLTLLPEYDDAGEVQDFPGAAMRILDQGVPASGFVVNVSDIIITSSTVGNAAVDPDAEAPADHTRWGFGTGPMFAGGIRTDSTTDGSDNVINITDSKVSHTSSRGVYIAHKTGTTAITTNVESKYNVGNAYRTFSTTGDWILNNCVGTHSSGNQTSSITTAGTAGAGTLIEINGGNFSNSTWYGLEFLAANTISIQGEPGNPVVVANNPNRGIRFDNASTVVTGLSHLVVANNASFGIDVNELDTDASWGDGISNLIMSGNGTISATPSNFSYGDTHTGAVTIEVTDSTFHNPSGDQGDSFIARNFDHRFGNDQVWNFTNCIFSGNAGDDDVAIIVRGTTDRNIEINLINSAVVTEGPYALEALEEIPDGGSPADINQTDVINSNPAYVTTDTSEEEAFNVQSPDYEDAGPGGAPLTGGAEYVGPPTSVEDWTTLTY